MVTLMAATDRRDEGLAAGSSGPGPDRSLRICLLTPELPPERVGGIGSYVAALAAELGRRGHRVDVAGYDLHPGPVVRRPWGRSLSLRPAGLCGGGWADRLGQVVRAAARRGVPGVWRLMPLAEAAPLVAATLAVRRFVCRRAARYDVIEYPNWPGHAALLPPGRGQYVVRLSTSAADTADGPATRLAVALERRAVRRANLVLAHSQAMCRKGHDLYGLPAGRCRVVPLGLPADRPPRRPPADAPLRLVTVGRAEDRKGTDLLITALARVLPRYPGVEFRFVGPGLPEYLAARPAVRAAWAGLQAACPDRVADHGRVSEAERDEAVGRSHWLVVPSRFESFGLVAVEALRLGTPVVYAAAGGLEEVGRACTANVPVRPDDPADLERALDAVCRAGPAAALAVRPAARRCFERTFSAAALADATLAAYADLPGLARRTPPWT